MAEKKQLGIKFWKVKNKEEALYIIKQCSQGFIFIAGLNIILGFFINIAAIIDGIIYLILGLLLFYFKSRISSILLLLISGAGIIIFFLNKIERGNLFLMIILFYCAIASVYTSFKYHKLR